MGQCQHQYDSDRAINTERSPQQLIVTFFNHSADTSDDIVLPLVEPEEQTEANAFGKVIPIFRRLTLI